MIWSYFAWPIRLYHNLLFVSRYSEEGSNRATSTHTNLSLFTKYPQLNQFLATGVRSSNLEMTPINSALSFCSKPWLWAAVKKWSDWDVGIGGNKRIGQISTGTVIPSALFGHNVQKLGFVIWNMVTKPRPRLCERNICRPFAQRDYHRRLHYRILHDKRAGKVRKICSSNL